MRPEVIKLVQAKLSQKDRVDLYPSLTKSRHLPVSFAKEILEYFLDKASLSIDELDREELNSLGYLASNPWLPADLRLKACDLLLALPDTSSGVTVGTLAHRTYLELRKKLAANPAAAPLLNPTRRQLAAGADNFTPEELDALYNAVIDSGGWNYPTLHGILELAYIGYDLQDAPADDFDDPPIYELTDEYLAPILDPVGLPGWHMFLSLLPGWSHSIKDLLQVSISTTHI